MKWKQFWCDHIWKTKSEEYLGISARYLAGVKVDEYTEYALHEKCLKCGKERISEARNKRERVDWEGGV